METPDQLKSASDEVLRRIGRNLLLFQHVELLLKFILARGSFRVTASELKLLAESGMTQEDRRMMGELIKSLISAHLTPIDSAALLPPASDELSISVNVTFHHTEEERAAFQRQLEELVAERNEFVHHALTRFSLRSLEGCKAASEALQNQRNRIWPVQEKLKNMLSSMVDALNALKHAAPNQIQNDNPG